MKYLDPDDSSPAEVRANALGSAIALRDCSLRRELSFPTRHGCRTLMRAQAIKWRQMVAGGERGRLPADEEFILCKKPKNRWQSVSN